MFELFFKDAVTVITTLAIIAMLIIIDRFFCAVSAAAVFPAFKMSGIISKKEERDCTRRR